MSRPFLLLGLLVLQCLSNKYDKESIRRLLGIVHKKFYIYSWPDVLDRWPDYYTHHRLALASGFKDNYGIGIRKNASEGLYHTHQYSLFMTFYYRLLESPYRTQDAAAADWFFIPFDLGMDSSVRKSDGALAKTDCPTLPLILERLLYDDTDGVNYFNRNGGSDHFLLHSINQMMTYYVHMRCMEFYRLCYNCTKLSIDVYGPGYFSMIDSNPFLRHRWVSIPFPSNYHYSEEVTSPPWRSKFMINGTVDPARTYALAYMGSISVTAKLQRNLRIVLRKTCLLFPKDCLLVNLNSHDSQTAIFSSLQDRGPYVAARLCLMPGGDFPTRKGVLDALLAGCVPVTFQYVSAQLQWTWHWGSLHKAEQCLVYVPRDQMMKNPLQAFESLLKIANDAELMKPKLQCIAEVGFRMQYNVPSGRNGGDIETMAGKDAVSTLAKLTADDVDKIGSDGGSGSMLLHEQRRVENNPTDAVDVVLQHLLAN